MQSHYRPRAGEIECPRCHHRLPLNLDHPAVSAALVMVTCPNCGGGWNEVAIAAADHTRHWARDEARAS